MTASPADRTFRWVGQRHRPGTWSVLR